MGVGSDHDVSAAEQFRDAEIDVVVPFVSGSSIWRACCVSPMRRIPTTRIVDLETGEHATDVSGSVMPAEIYEGTPALVMSRASARSPMVGTLSARRRTAAVAAVEPPDAAEHRPVGRGRRSGELSNILLVADLVSILCAAFARPRPT